MKHVFLALIFASLIYQGCFANNAGNPDVSWYNNTKNTFILSTSEQLLGLAKLTNEGNTFENKKLFLVDNINLNGITWEPIGTPENPFRGYFDGGLHKVTFSEISASEYAGFFGYVQNASISNVSVSYSNPVNNCRNFGAIAGASDSRTIISFCRHVDTLIVKDANVVGGISATSDAFISGCCNDGAIISDQKIQSFVGGLVGMGAPTIENSQNNATIECCVVGGGIVGKLSNVENTIVISNCTNNGDISVNSKSDNPAYQYTVGGIIGVAPFVSLNYCKNEGKVTLQSYKDIDNVTLVKAYAAGLIGEGAGKIKYCYNKGEVFVRNIVNTNSNVAKVLNAVAGIIGMNTEKGITEISFTYNSGKILTFGQSPIKVSQNYGGIVGNFMTFMPKMTGVYSLENCCNVLESKGSTVTSTCNNTEIQVSFDQMSSQEFLVPQKSTITLNNDLVFLRDTENRNDKLPVLKNVVTCAPKINDDGSVTVVGLSGIPGKRYFRYWITGMENYSVDIEADDDFTYNIGKAAVGEHNIKAYVILPDNIKEEGERLSFVVKDIDSASQDTISSTEIENMHVNGQIPSTKKRYVNRNNRRR